MPKLQQGKTNQVKALELKQEQALVLQPVEPPLS